MFNPFVNKAKKNLEKITYESSSANILHDETEFVVNEAYKAMRTNIMFSFHEKEGCKTIICTSAMPGEGKTTTCINMAISFAQAGNRVLIIDGDLRKPKVGSYLDIEQAEGISDYLGGFVKEYNSIIKHVEDKSIDCIMSGSIPPNPAELLGSNGMENLLSKLSENYDYIFIDAPPVNVVTDAVVTARFCSGAVVVVRENNTTHDMLKNALGIIKFADIKILGLVVNGSEIKAGGKYSYNKKSYNQSNA